MLDESSSSGELARELHAATFWPQRSSSTPTTNTSFSACAQRRFDFLGIDLLAT
jgi:hypothetical protein